MWQTGCMAHASVSRRASVSGRWLLSCCELGVSPCLMSCLSPLPIHSLCGFDHSQAAGGLEEPWGSRLKESCEKPRGVILTAALTLQEGKVSRALEVFSLSSQARLSHMECQERYWRSSTGSFLSLVANKKLRNKHKHNRHFIECAKVTEQHHPLGTQGSGVSDWTLTGFRRTGWGFPRVFLLSRIHECRERHRETRCLC